MPITQAKYGTQTGNDWQWYPDAGNGVLKSTGANITGNDPSDANVASDSLYQQGWMQHLVNTFGTAGAGGLKYYIMDNEPSIWFSTHRDVAPTGATMAQVRDKILDYAGRAKTVDPMAQVVGPEEWGWSGYFYSGYDQQWGNLHGWSSLPDRTANGNMDHLPWLLDQLRQKTVAGGLKPLDIFSVHYYPQGGEFSNDVSSTMQLRCNRSTRSLWDPNYVDETWINDKVQLIRRNADHGHGIQLGRRSLYQRPTAQADIYGIFGRENLDMATR